MNDKQKLEKIVEDAESIKIPSNEFFHRHFLVHEAGKTRFHSRKTNKRRERESEREREREREIERKR